MECFLSEGLSDISIQVDNPELMTRTRNYLLSDKPSVYSVGSRLRHGAGQTSGYLWTWSRCVQFSLYCKTPPVPRAERLRRLQALWRVWPRPARLPTSQESLKFAHFAFWPVSKAARVRDVFTHFFADREKVNVDVYCNVVKIEIITWMKTKSADKEYIFQQNSVPANRARKIVDLFKRSGVRFCEMNFWPSNSHDL